MGRPHVAILLTDGRATGPESVLNDAINRFHAADLFQVYTIGIGTNADINELNAIASDPSLVYSESFDSTGILQLQNDVSQQLRGGSSISCNICVLYKIIAYRFQCNGRPSFYGSIGIW